MKLIKIAICIALLSTWSLSFADTASKKEAEKLLNTLGLKEASDQALDRIIDIQLKQIPERPLYKKLIKRFITKHMSYESLKPDMIKIYSEAFTTSELRELNKFYATDIGQKTIEKMPVLLIKSAQLSTDRFLENIDEFQSMIELIMKTESERTKNP